MATKGAASPPRPVITATGVSKRYVTHGRKATALKERFVQSAKGQGGIATEFWALKDVDVVVGEGETVGLIGPNGAGKSTLLKILAGILRPTSGVVHVEGRIASLLELGAGFNAELTGRENVYLNAALLGLSKKEVDHLFASILEFSEQGPRIDDPVKHYSSGEYVKLAFAIAVHVDPDILLVDEVLAVGDEAFARKCLAKISEFQHAGKTILFVTHALDLVEQLCTRGIVVDHGVVQYDGDPAFAVGTLRKILGTDRPADAPNEPEAIGGMVVVDAVASTRRGGAATDRVRPGRTLHVRVQVDVQPGEGLIEGELQVVVMGAGDIPVLVLRTVEGGHVPAVPGRYTVDLQLPEMPPLVGAFILGVSVLDPESGRPISARRFDQAFWVLDGPRGALLHLPTTATVRS
ncbi:MAG: ABC transporter ATP-binding protein [Frankiaceae bacterium]|nr:ABC transporter ATP-binding protein [Frankiaceae bacterium]